MIGVAAYRSTGAATVSASAVGGSDASSSSHTAPAVAIEEENSWLVTVWTEKSSTGPDLDAAVGHHVAHHCRRHRQRQDQWRSGATRMRRSRRVPRRTGSTATTSAGRVPHGHVLHRVAPGDVPEPTNQAPTAEFTADCSGLTCEFDASGSSDPDGDDLTYSWNFGDSEERNRRLARTHLRRDGQRTVTLTVSDGRWMSKRREVNPVAAVQQGSVSFVAAASTAGNRSGHTVRIPATVKPNDRLLLFLTTNTTTGTLTTPSRAGPCCRPATATASAARLWTRWRQPPTPTPTSGSAPACWPSR